MKNNFVFFALLFFALSCSDAQVKKTNYLLSPMEFSKTIQQSSSAVILDVRTPEEYERGHLNNATNVNWNSDNFQSRIMAMDTTQTFFVYCLSGGRSSSAAAKMRSMGLQRVYELDGGISAWRGAGLSETTDKPAKPLGMTIGQFDSLLVSDKIILVNFNASWCAPCKKMKPELDQLGSTNKELLLLRLDADENAGLFKELKLEIIPTTLLYKNKKPVWIKTGYCSKEEIVAQLEKIKQQ